ncbi:GntR family transcriptional regulator [Acetobacter conturbans]|uniref:FCD domain-containing protein n=1 Tax=Acetobacter conturbans TaxID=1737472 RepID=A0ABX0K4P3_9PROT|nr:FCD domain-containing protein [Acetobacter conturbans]NHN89781.1 FCD domain-containing protein [Acetobacter conturbans]
MTLNTSSIRPVRNSTHRQFATANSILALLRRENAAPDFHVGEQWLGDQLGLSRTPVRNALKLLESRGILVSRKNQGYFLRANLETIEDFVLEAPPTPDQDLYKNLVRDRLAGRIGNDFSQQDVSRLYNAERTVMIQTLRRMCDDGLLQSKGTRTWSFAPALDSGAALEESFRFRRLFEPQAILLPTFRVDEAVLEETMRLHNHIATHPDIDSIPPRFLFDADSRFHEMIAEFSHNTFVIQTMRQQSRLRRLLEYGSYTNRTRVHLWCQEHIAIMDALAGNSIAEASRLLGLHLDLALNAANLLIEEKDIPES